MNKNLFQFQNGILVNKKVFIAYFLNYKVQIRLVPMRTLACQLMKNWFQFQNEIVENKKVFIAYVLNYKVQRRLVPIRTLGCH
jgi:hypothetical protein